METVLSLVGLEMCLGMLGSLIINLEACRSYLHFILLATRTVLGIVDHFHAV